MRRIITITVAALLAMVVLSSCDGKKNYNNMVAKAWSLETIEYADSNYIEHPPAEKDIFIEFDDSIKIVFGQLGCNTFRGEYSVDGDDKIKFGQLASTMMWCNNMEFEDRYSKVLGTITNFKASEHELIFTNEDNSVTLRYLEQTAAPETIQKIEDKVEDALDEAGDKLDEAGEELEEVIEKVEDEVEENLNELKEKVN